VKATFEGQLKRAGELLAAAAAGGTAKSW